MPHLELKGGLAKQVGKGKYIWLLFRQEPSGEDVGRRSKWGSPVPTGGRRWSPIGDTPALKKLPNLKIIFRHERSGESVARWESSGGWEGDGYHRGRARQHHQERPTWCCSSARLVDFIRSKILLLVVLGAVEVVDVPESQILMAGLVDSHVH